MLEYAAPACPHCARFDETVFPLLKKNYIDTGKVFYIFRVFPIMPADGAAEAIARCLPADKYFRFIDLLFRNQKIWDPEYGVTDVRGGLVQMARIAGMSCRKSRSVHFGQGRAGSHQPSRPGWRDEIQPPGHAHLRDQRNRA